MNFCKCGCGKTIGAKSEWAKGHNPNKTKDRFDWSNIIKDYEELKTLEKVAIKYGCTLQAVYSQLKKRGINTNHRKLNYGKLAAEYGEVKSVNKVAKLNNCSPSQVSLILQKVNGQKLNHDNKHLNNEVGVGRFGEKIALNLLENSIDMNKNDVHSSFDILWEGKRIDVKTSFPRRKDTEFSFNCKNSDCDHFLFVCLNEDTTLRKAFLVPTKEIQTNSVTLNLKNNKFNQYKLGA